MSWQTFERHRRKWERKYNPKLRSSLITSYSGVIDALKGGTSPNTLLDSPGNYVNNSEMALTLSELYIQVGGDFGRRSYTKLKSAMPDMECKGELDDVQTIIEAEIMDNIIEGTGNRITKKTAAIFSTSLEEVQRVVKNGVALAEDQGWGISKLTSYVENELNISSRWRAMRISATEVNTASNFGDLRGAKLTGLPFQKEWQAGGPSIRDTHIAASGQIVEENDMFIVGGYELAFPGDDSHGAGAEEIINCKCAMNTLTKV